MAEPAKLKFPDPWPDDCPPADAVDADGIVYRLVKTDPPVARDFRTNIEKKTLPDAPPCLRAGLSVMRTLDDIRHQADLFPYIGRYIGEATLAQEHGKTKLTPGCAPSHTTWWVYDGVDRPVLFRCVGEVP